MVQQSNKFNLLKEVKSFLIAFTGFILLALVIDLISWKYQLISGGFPGFGLLMSYLTGYSVGTIMLFLNIVIFTILLLLGDVSIGLKTAIGYIVFPFIVDGFRVLLDITQTPTPSFFYSTLALSIQALVAGVGATLFFSQSYSAGGWGALALVIKKRFHLSGPKFLLGMDVILTILVSLTQSISKGIMLGINTFFFYYSFKYSLQYYEKLTSHSKR